MIVRASTVFFFVKKVKEKTFYFIFNLILFYIYFIFNLISNIFILVKKHFQ